MKKMLFVLCVVIFASLIASAQLVSPTTYDRTYSGYCDGARLVLQKLTTSGTGSTKVYVGGFHDLIDACGGSVNPPIVGNKAGAGATVPPHQLSGVSGPVLYTADEDLDGSCLCYRGIQFEFVYDLVHEFSTIYEAFQGANGDYFCCDQSLTIGLPSKTNGNAVAKPAAGGTFGIARKQQ